MHGAFIMIRETHAQDPAYRPTSLTYCADLRAAHVVRANEQQFGTPAKTVPSS